jgi:hypothetical protein
MFRSIYALLIALVLIVALVLGRRFPPQASLRCQQIAGQSRIQYQCVEGAPGKDAQGQPGPQGKPCLYSIDPSTGDAQCTYSGSNELIRYKLKKEQNKMFERFATGFVLIILIVFLGLFIKMTFSTPRQGPAAPAPGLPWDFSDNLTKLPKAFLEPVAPLPSDAYGRFLLISYAIGVFMMLYVINTSWDAMKTFFSQFFR